MKCITKIIISTLVVFFINCKEKAKISDIKSKDPEYTINESVNDTNVKSIKETNIPNSDDKNILNSNSWTFYKISENPLVNLNTMTRQEIMNEFNKTKIEISEKIINVNGYCTFEPYITKNKPLKYFSSKKTFDLYKNELSKSGIKLSDNITIYQSLYPEKECKNPSAEYFETDNTLVFSYQGYLLFFKKGAKPFKENIDCYSKTKITNLPITKNVINGGNVWNQLDCNIGNLDTKDYLRLPDINDVKIFIIGNFNYDDFIYTLVTLKNNKVVTTKKIGFAEGGDDGNTISKFTEFEISKDFVFNLNTKTSKDGVFKTIKQEKFKIDQNGLLVGVK